MNGWDHWQIAAQRFEDQFRQLEQEIEQLIGTQVVIFIKSEWKLTDEGVVIRLYIPGLTDKHEIHVQAQDRQLSIQGVIEQKRKHFPYQVKTSFVKTMMLPVPVDSSGIQTKVNKTKNVVMIYLPKKRNK